MAIYSCKGCDPPKRYPGCHAHCPEYLAQKEEHDRLKAGYDSNRQITSAIYCERRKKVARAMRKRGSYKK